MPRRALVIGGTLFVGRSDEGDASWRPVAIYPKALNHLRGIALLR